jgi:hypothetical protein
MKGMARTHLPFQTPNEARFRFIGAYYLGLLLEQMEGGSVNWSLDGLNTFFAELAVANAGFSERIKSAAEEDNALQALNFLADMASEVQLSLDNSIDDLMLYALPVSQS